MNIKKKLETLLQYYLTTRQVGHTTLMKEGTNHYDKPFFVLCHSMVHGESLGFDVTNTISYGNPDKLRGHNRPLVIDNGVIPEILSDALMRIETLEEENEKLRKMSQTILVGPNDELWKAAEKYKKQVDRLNKQGKTPFVGKKRH
jgi:hypothetical protein